MLSFVTQAFRAALQVCGITAFVLGASAVAQEPDGTSWQQKPGIALVKPQPWSPDDFATVVEFQAFTDRTVKGRQSAGYFVFHNGNSPDSQIPVARIVKMLVFVEPPRELVRVEQRAALQKIIDEYTALGAKFPSAGRSLEKFLSSLRADAAKYDAGNVKDETGWMPKSTYYKKKADDLYNLAVLEIKGAPKVRDLNLSLSQYYAGLEDLARLEPSAQSKADGVRSLYESLRRKEERGELIGKLKAPDVTFENSELYVRTLKTLQPAEDPAATQFLEVWDRAVRKAAQLNGQVSQNQVALEKEMAAMTDPSKPVLISDALAAQIHLAAEALSDFRKESPPAAIEVPAPLAKAMSDLSANLPGIGKEMTDHHYYEAKLLIADVLSGATLVGPNTAAAVDALQKKSTAEIQKFEALRDEAKALQDTGKTNEAVMKYREAWATMPDKDVAEKIESLKK